MATLVRAETSTQFDEIRALLAEYVASLPVDVSYEDVPRECAALPGVYGPPRGELLLALQNGRPAGCAALRPLDAEIAELKRVYVRPEFRGLGIGRALVEAILVEARRIGYRRLRLDTIPALKTALTLYRSLGFRVIAPYRAIPSDRALFLELPLGTAV